MNLAAALFLLTTSGGVGDPPDPQARGAKREGGGRAWLELEAFDAVLKADKANGTDTDFDSSSDFNSSIDTTLRAAIPWLAGGYEFDFGLTLYAKLGYAHATLRQDIGSGSVLGPPDIQQGGGFDPFFAFGFGADFRREVSRDFVILGRAEFTMGRGDFENYLLQDTLGDGDVDWQRITLRVAAGYQTEICVVQAGLRFSQLTFTVDLEEQVPGPESFEVDYVYDTPVGLFIGASNRLGERVSWRAEIGFIDAISVEVGVGLDF